MQLNQSILLFNFLLILEATNIKRHQLKNFYQSVWAGANLQQMEKGVYLKTWPFDILLFQDHYNTLFTNI